MGPDTGTNVFELDTKGICLLCLRNCSLSTSFKGQLNGYASSSSSSSSSKDKDLVFQSFKMLMRYLNIDLLQQCCNFTPTFLQTVDGLQRDVNMIVKLCSVCLEMCQEFSQIYKQFEMIRLQLDECVQALFHMMQSGDKDKDRKREYERTIKEGTSWNPLQLFHANIADNLRKETLRKCSLKVDKLIPRVTISKPISFEDRLPNKLDFMPPSPNPICVITQTKGDLNDEEFEGPTSMLKVETVFTNGETSAAVELEEVLNLNLNHEDKFIDVNSSDGYYDDPLSISNNYDDPDTADHDPPYKPSSSASAGAHHQCRYCPNKRFFSSGNLRVHLICVHPLQHFADRLPDGTSDSQLRASIEHCVKQHQRVHTAESNGKLRYLCAYCTKDLRDTFNLKLHVLDNHFNEIIIALSLQDLVPSSSSKKTVAVKRTGGGGIGPGRKGKGKVGRPRGGRHKPAHSGPTYKCPVCRRDFTVLSCMKRHYKLFHTREGGQKHRCDFCQKSFVSAFNLKVHINTVHLYEAHRHKLPPEVSETQLKQTIVKISKEQARERGPNRLKVGVKCEFCGKINNDAFFFKTHLVEYHFEEVVNRLGEWREEGLGGGGGDSSSSSNQHLQQFQGHLMEEENGEGDEEELPIENFIENSFMDILLDGGEGVGANNEAGGEEVGLERPKSGSKSPKLTLRGLLGHDDDDLDSVSDIEMPPVLDKYGNLD